MNHSILLTAPSALALALCAGAAAAHEPEAAKPAGAAVAPKAAGTVVAPKTARVIVTTPAALTVVRDPVTGELRAPTAEEAEALASAPRQASFARSAAPVQRTFVTRSGARGVNLGESTFAYSVARLDAKGQVEQSCVTGPEAASQYVGAPVSVKAEPAHE